MSCSGANPRVQVRLLARATWLSNPSSTFCLAPLCRSGAEVQAARVDRLEPGFDAA